ncbi:putative RAD17 protein [Apodospora peruviana]|uniref:RAD17 protein n=1 Tax=Apodospora peruviana TaxID=516989 RepID=A0AAE0MFN7_9PEZI|nr:putative RAD17 protein [Apodospora peruviana]
MAPAAKRRKRAIVDDSDDDENGNGDNDLDQNKSRNTLKRFLFSSPDARQTAASRDPTASPSPVRKKSTRATAAAETAASTAVVSSSVPPGGIQNRLFSTSRKNKSPSTSPDKRRATRANKKTKAEDKEKGKTADLLTLFSKQAQRSAQSSVAASSNGTKDLSSFALDDIISDPVSEDDDLALHKTASASSIVGKTAHRRFKESSQSGIANPAVGQRFLKAPKLAASARVMSEPDCRPWPERFGPANLDELAVHKRKVADVRKWLEDVLSGRVRQRLLVLKGAAGTGKTTTVQLLARDLRCEILEWRNPANSFGAVQGYQPASAQFEEFLGRGGRFGQLDIESSDPPPPPPPPAAVNSAARGAERRLILIEEFPNTFMRSSTGLTSFRNTILQFLAANVPSLTGFGRDALADPVTPIVMIVSETLLTTTSASADSFTAHRLLGAEILRHPGTGLIEFNPIAPSLLAKALELVVQKEARKSGRRRTPGPLVLKRLGEIGDIRNAISSLEFLCVKGDDDADWGSKVAFTKPKRGSKGPPSLTKGEKDSLMLVSQREATLGIFHAVGKVVYNKRGDPAPAGSAEAEAEMLPDYMVHLSRPKPSQVSVDTLIDETGTDTHTFISALHENFALSCEQNSPNDPNSSLDYLNGCLESLSESDMLCPSWDVFFGGSGGGYSGGYFGKDSGSHILRQDEMAFQVAVRGLLFSLPSPVKRQTHPTGRGGDAFKMFYPAYLKLWRTKEELEGLVDMWSTKMLKGEDGAAAGSSSSSGSRTGSLTNRSMAFRKPKPNNGNGSSTSVQDWASSQKRRLNRQETADSTTTTTTAAAPPLLLLGNSARQEMLLERLPYMAHIARRRKCTFGTMRIKDLDRIVSFQGIGPPKTDDSSDVEQDDVDAADGDAWATDKPTEENASPQKKRKRSGQGVIGISRATGGGGGGYYDEDAVNGMETLPMQSLVLSDDDIEDDFYITTRPNTGNGLGDVPYRSQRAG